MPADGSRAALDGANLRAESAAMRRSGGQLIGLALTIALLAGCGSGPSAECQAPPSGAAETIACDVGVSLARDELAPDHPDVSRIQFLYGTFRPVSVRPGWQTAYVVFTYADASRQAIQLRQFNGQLSAEGPRPY